MLPYKTWYINKYWKGGLPGLVLVWVFNIAFCFTGNAQNCPPNIDFETGTFDGWTCYAGSNLAVGNDNVISISPTSGPIYNRHTMYSALSGQVDFYGGFPVSCPNGSGHSIRLGNSLGGGEAEGISYEFTIPANENNYSLIYHYAVVFQSPNHRLNEQPRMEIEITNVTDDKVINCASFAFIALGSSLPGFEISTKGDTTAVLYKNWSAVSVDLAGNAGKTIKLFFKTGDCTFRRHFGYAYIDVNSECSGSFVGANYCPDDTLINVVAPFGYQGYTWYDSSLTKVLGTSQILRLSPPPPSGTKIAVKIVPFDGYGCLNTLYTTLKDTLSVKANAGKDTLSCNGNPVPIGTIPKAGLIYSWSPMDSLSNSEIANPFAFPKINTNYIVTTTNSGGGCLSLDTVLVRASLIDNFLQVIGKSTYCIDNGDSSILKVKPTTNIQWFKNDVAINGAKQTVYRVNTSGTYYSFLKNAEGCMVTTQKQPIVIDKAKPGIRYPLQYAVINLPLSLEARQIGDSVLWKPATNLNTPTSFKPIFQGTLDRLYIINIKTITECLTVDTQQVKIIEKVEVYIPTAFTPNYDGRNDFLHPVMKGIKEVHFFRIFNRWGQLIFDTKKELPGWEGTFKGVPADPQTIVWFFEGVGVDGVLYRKKGSTILLR